MRTHSLIALLGYLIIGIFCLCGVLSAATPDPPPTPQQCEQAQPPASPLDTLQSLAVKGSLLAALGIILALIPSTKMNLFENGVDIFFSCVTSCLFCVLLFYDDGQNSIPLTNRVVGMVVLGLLLVPYALIANGGKIWTLLVILPARLVVAVLVMLCGICFFLTSVAMAAGRQRKGIFTASFFGLATLGLGKLIQYTTKSYRNA